MTMILRSLSVLLLVCAATAAERFSDEQLKARFYYDLGAAELDVSGYPQEQQANYRLFAKTCSQCHTLSRPINAPISDAKDWKRYIARMHQRTKSAPKTKLSPADAKTILAFLAFDSEQRKVKGKAAFEAQAEQLKKTFNEVQAERGRLQKDADDKKVKPHYDPTGAAPKAP